MRHFPVWPLLTTKVLTQAHQKLHNINSNINTKILTNTDTYTDTDIDTDIDTDTNPDTDTATIDTGTATDTDTDTDTVSLTVWPAAGCAADLPTSGQTCHSAVTWPVAEWPSSLAVPAPAFEVPLHRFPPSRGAGEGRGSAVRRGRGGGLWAKWRWRSYENRCVAGKDGASGGGGVLNGDEGIMRIGVWREKMARRGGGGIGGYQHRDKVRSDGDLQSQQTLGNSVPKFADLGGSWHPTVDNFPLSLFYFWSEYPTPNSLLNVSGCNHTAATAVLPKSEKFSHSRKINSIHFAPKFPLLLSYLNSYFPLWHPGKNNKGNLLFYLIINGVSSLHVKK